jgi:uncharacterized protein YodC (DUF2158 family)
MSSQVSVLKEGIDNQVMPCWVRRDVVQLISGGPVMTVDTVISRSRVKCVWFNDGELLEAEFYSDTIVEVVSETNE